MAGGYIPPVLHSFLYNFKVLKVKQTKKKLDLELSDVSHTWTVRWSSDHLLQ